jgi:hypothetical protein
MKAALVPETFGLPFWRQEGAEARAAGLARDANPFLRIVAASTAGPLRFDVIAACSGAWIEGWGLADEDRSVVPASVDTSPGRRTGAGMLAHEFPGTRPAKHSLR